MKSKTHSTQSDILNTQLNADQTDNSNSSIATNEPIEGTPFRLIQQNEKWFIVMGDQRLTKPTSNKETTLLKLENEKWDIVVSVVLGILMVENKLNNIKIDALEEIRKEAERQKNSL